MDGTTVARWREWSGDGIQHLVLHHRPERIVAEAAVIGADGEVRFGAHFRIVCDGSWRVRRVEASVVGVDRRITLEADGAGRWRDDAAAPLADLHGAIDVDLPITPFTNTLPIRRLGLAAGQSADIDVVYVRLPELTVTTDPQRYVCLDPLRRYRFESRDSDFARELEVDSEGLVIDYPGLFRRVR